MTRDTTPAPAPLFEPTVADLQQAIDVLRESEAELMADVDRLVELLSQKEQQIRDLEDALNAERARP